MRVGSIGIAACLATGTGAVGGSADAFRLSQPGRAWRVLATASTQGSDLARAWLQGNLTGNEGNFSIAPGAWEAYQKLAVGFYLGDIDSGPDWVVFSLANGTALSTWVSEAPVLYAVLYGAYERTPTVETALPEPGSLALAGLGLAAVVLNRRQTRRRRVPAG